VFAEYLSRLLPMGPGQIRGVAALLILVLAAAQYRSVRFGAAIQNASTVAKVLAILAMTAAAFLLGAPGGGAWTSGPAPDAASWSGFGLGVVAVLWAYNGWQDVTCLSGEVRDPARALPRAIVGGTLAVVVIYLLANAAYLRVLSIGEIARSPLVAADLAVRLVGPAGAALIAALVCVSTFGALNAVIMAIPRVFWAMADDGLFFRTVAAVHPRYRTPHMAITALAGLAMLYFALQSFEQLVEAFVLASLRVLRRRRPDLPRVYRTPGYPLVPLVFVAAMVALVANSLWEHPGITVVSLGGMAAGIPLYLAWRRVAARR
jgi:APA family basic amino acid/polyamine antiporter